MRSVTLIGNDGTPLDLSQPPYSLAANPALWGMPPVATQTSTMLGVGGARRLGSRFLPRPLQAGMWIQAGSTVDLDEALAALARWVNPEVGPCRLIVDRGDGRTRQVTVHYSSGFEAISVRDRDRERVYVPLVFVAHDPYWEATAQVEYDILAGEFIGAEPTPFNAPINFNSDIPFNGFNASGIQHFSLVVAGDVATWPRWSIEGPALQLTAGNVTTGQMWAYEPALATGARFVMDTRPEARRVTLDDANAFPSLSDDSQLWSLVPGRNHISLRAQNWAAGSSKMVLSWRERFLTC